jgi:riboflavin biosynthesis pyrimidine reductase
VWAAVLVQRVHPDGEVLDAAVALEDLKLGERATPERPHVVLNMVATADGHATVGGRSAPMSSDADREVFHALRGQVDAVLAGTATLHAERYGRLVRDPERRAAREARGLAADPLAVLLSRSGDVPADLPLREDPEQPVALFCGADAEPATALRTLRERHDVRALLCEGGPTLNGALLRAGLVDELFLTVAPLLAAGDAPRTIVAGDAPDAPLGLVLVWVLHHEGSLFLRYRVGGPA